MTGARVSVSRILNLLQENSNLQVAREFLKQHGLPHSAGSWNALEHERIRPYLEDGRLTVADLMILLRDAEEFGSQHVFLYKASPETVRPLADEQHLQAMARDHGLEPALNSNLLLDEPNELTIGDLRVERDRPGVKVALIIKLIGQRTRWETETQSEEADGSKTIRQYPVYERTVNVLRLHESGLLEVRVNSHRNSSHYVKERQDMLALVEPLLPLENFTGISLSTAKDRLWFERDSLRHKIRFSDSQLRNELGTVVTAATGAKESNLYEDPGASNSVESFYNDGGYFSGSNIWFRQEPNDLSRDVHVRLAGELNEFAIPAQCTRTDYEHVLSELLAINKKVSA